VPLGMPVTRSLPPRNAPQEETARPRPMVTTGKEADWIPPLPSRYTTLLQVGTAPELVIWDIFKRLIELRNLLEEAVTSLPPELRNNQIKRAEAFLRSHCAACGHQIHPAEEGSTPICDQCQNM
jgi:hypothetical protein